MHFGTVTGLVICNAPDVLTGVVKDKKNRLVLSILIDELGERFFQRFQSDIFALSKVIEL